MKLAGIGISMLSVLALTVPTITHANRSAAKPHAFPVTIIDDLGNHITIARQPKRILSLDPRDTETLFALGLEKRLVGDGGKGNEGAVGYSRSFRYPSEWPSPWGRDYPTRAKLLPHVEGGCCGSPWNLETIASLQPDIIFSLDSDLPSLQKMRDLGYKLVVLNPSNFKGIVHDIQIVGRATGANAQAKVVTGAMNRQLAGVRRALQHVRDRISTYYEIDASNPTQPYTAGPGTFIDEAIRLAGGQNVAAGVSSPGCPGAGCYVQISLESLIKLDPHVILLGDAAYGTTVSSVRSRPGWSTIWAVQKGTIYPYDDELISRAGPRIAVGIRKIAYRIHPETFGHR